MRAHAKFILGGEHSILQGGRALAFPLLDLELVVRESPEDDGLRLNGVLQTPADFERYLSLRKRLGIESPLRGARIDSSIPVGAGLGSSAALCVALSRLHFPQEDARALALRALEGERAFHGRPSGLDPFTVAIAKPIVFQSGSLETRPVHLDHARAAGLSFVLRDSGLRHQTRTVIEALQTRRERESARVQDSMAALSRQVEVMIEALESGHIREVGAAMNEAHAQLAGLGLSAQSLDAAVAGLKNAGARGAKLTGAGCGGFALGIFESDRRPEGLLPSDIWVGPQDF